MNHQTIRPVFAPARPVIGTAAQRFRLGLQEPQHATPGKPRSRVVLRPTSTVVSSSEKATQPAAYSPENADAILELCLVAGKSLKEAKAFLAERLTPGEVLKRLVAERRLAETTPAVPSMKVPNDVMVQTAIEMGARKFRTLPRSTDAAIEQNAVVQAAMAINGIRRGTGQANGQ